ncbi:MAG: prolyl oligopeptidase family serine peptidase [Chakrabartia sp.]
MLRPLMMTALVAMSAPALAKPVPPTIEQMAAFPKMASFTISPDGTHMAAIEARGEERVILVWKTANLNEKPTVIGSTTMKIQGVQFIKNDLLAVLLWQPYDAKFDGITKTFITKLFITDLQGKKWQEPMPLPRAKTEIEERIQAITNPTVLDILPNDPDHIILVNNVSDGTGDVFKVNIRTNRAEKIQRSDEKVFGYVTDLDGNVRARRRLDIDGKGAFNSIELRASNGGWEEHFRTYVKDRDVFDVIGFTGDPNIALISSNVGADKTAIYEYDIAAKKLGETVFKHRYFEANGVSVRRIKNSPGGSFGEITSLSYSGPREDDVIYTSPEYKAIEATIRKALGITQKPLTLVDTATGVSGSANYDTTQTFRIVSSSDDLKTIVIVVNGPNTPSSFYMLKDGRLNLLSKSYPDIDPAALGETKLVYYKARDGQDIPGFLTKPNAEMCGAGPWPTVIHPHGGPWARDDLAFDGGMWVPLMASRCMAVLQPQYRGSLGWGRKLWKAGDAEWGQKMQDDKDDGVKWLIEQKVAIPERVAMFGFSYGGYAAMAAAVRPNGLYKCAIAGAGVSDIKRIWSAFYTSTYFRENQGSTVKGLSPADVADKIKIPIMVYHGERDQTVPIEQSRWFVAKAKQSGQPVVYHEIKDYSHGPAWTRAIMAQQLKYIDDYLVRDCGSKGL